MNSSEKVRIRWLDYARGFTMLCSSTFWYLPWSLREEFSFFMAHPANSGYVRAINVFDLGVITFIFCMGLSMAISVRRRLAENSWEFVSRHIFFRCSLLIVLNYLIVLISGKDFLKIKHGEILIKSGLPVFEWGVLVSLGVVGILALLVIRWTIVSRIILSFTLISFYQFMLTFSNWREHVIASTHSGILGTVFGYGAVMIFATALGDLLFNRKKTSNNNYRYDNYCSSSWSLFIKLSRTILK